MDSSSPLLTLAGLRWKRELRGVFLWVGFAYTFGISCGFLGGRPPSVGALLFAGALLPMLIIAIMLLLFPLSRGPYQTITLTSTELVVTERKQVQTIPVDAIAALEIILDVPAGRNRPAHYSLHLRDQYQQALGIVNVNAFEASQLLDLLAQLQLLLPQLNSEQATAQLGTIANE